MRKWRSAMISGLLGLFSLVNMLRVLIVLRSCSWLGSRPSLSLEFQGMFAREPEWLSKDVNRYLSCIAVQYMSRFDRHETPLLHWEALK